MGDAKATTQCSSEKSVPGTIEKDAYLPAMDVDNLQQEKSRVAATVSGDRDLVLMDLESGLVGWESDKDPENPQ